MNKIIELSIVIPVYNEKENIEPLFQEIVAVLSPQRFLYEVIFVDDGSSDGTVSCLEKLKKSNPNLRLACHKKNFGQSAALVTGAKMARYSLMTVLDGDGQNDPADIVRLCEQMKDENTVVLGHRIKRHDNSWRRFCSWTGNSIRRFFLQDLSKDTGCSLKLFPREAFLSLPHFDHLHRFLPALFLRAGYQLVSVPVNHRHRWHGVSKYGLMNRLFVGIYDLIGVRWLLKRPCKPEIL